MFNKLGYYSLYEEETKIIEKLDKDFIRLISNYKINHWKIPALIDGDVLKRCGYFSSMPNQLTQVCHLNDSGVENMLSHREISNEDICCNDNAYLTPAACIHFYPMLGERKIKNEIITTQARVYRFEDGKYSKGKRLWDFTVREFVAVGNEDFVKSFLYDFRDKLFEYAKIYSNNISIVNANDHFYPSKENKIKERFQKNNNLKQELVADVNNDKVALSSFNYHGLHFSKEFGFDDGGKTITGCVGCGIERWLHMIESESKIDV